MWGKGRGNHSQKMAVLLTQIMKRVIFNDGFLGRSGHRVTDLKKRGGGEEILK